MFSHEPPLNKVRLEMRQNIRWKTALSLEIQQDQIRKQLKKRFELRIQS